MLELGQKELREWEAKCTQEEPPFCMAACPVHVDGRAISSLVSQGKYDDAREIYEHSVVFPNILCRICDRPCEQSCLRKESGGAIRLRALERIVMERGAPKKRRGFLPRCKNDVAVLGCGLCALSATVELARKGIRVSLFTCGNKLGGELLEYAEDALPEEAILKDLASLEEYPVTLVEEARPEISVLTDKYDAVFIDYRPAAREMNGFPGLDAVNQVTLQTAAEKIFVGTEDGTRPVYALLEGKKAAVSIYRYLQQSALEVGREKEGAFSSALFTETGGITPAAPFIENDGQCSEDGAKLEAGRCLACQCMECVKSCAYLAYYKTFPRKHIRAVYNNLSIVMGNHAGNSMINACSLCGQCAAICPSGFDVGSICRMARETMVDTQKMPQSTFDFALKDMAYSNGPDCALACNEPGQEQSAYLFFPGCQLSASDPEVVEKAYSDLKARLSGGVGLYLSCCGAIADWAGQRMLFEETIKNIHDTCENMGKPIIVAACPTCYAVFTAHLPDMKILTIWDVFLETGLPSGVRMVREEYAVHDACTIRENTGFLQAVRNIAKKIGCTIHEVQDTKTRAPCCGWGGLASLTDRNATAARLGKRSGETALPYLTYCVNCRDGLASKQKPTVHLLDLVYGVERELRAPNWSEKRYNRRKLRSDMLKRHFGEPAMEKENPINLIIDNEVQGILDERMILHDDIKEVIGHAEKTGLVVKDTGTGSFVASLRLANVTYWVRYQASPDGYVIRNAYSHRMDMEAGDVGDQ
jgi:Fe-S oxidoreductase